MFRLQWLLMSMVAMGLEGTCSGQKASNWRVYKLADGLPESACISVTVSPQGKVFARHFALPVISELDGYDVRTNIPAPQTGQGRVYQSPGGQLWTVVPQGLLEFKEGGWLLHPIAELANELRGAFIDRIPLWPVRQGLVLLLLPNRLLAYNSESPERPQTKVLREAGRTQLESFLSLAASRDGDLWIGGARGLAKIPGPVRNLRPETEWTEYVPPDSLKVRNLQGLHEDEEGGLTMVAESVTNQQRMVLYFDGRDWSIQNAPTEKLRQAWRSADRTRWAMSTAALFECEEGQPELTETDEVSARTYFDVAAQPGRTFWLATSDGLYRYAPALWRSPAAVRTINSPVRCLVSDPSGRLWFTAGSKLCLLQGDQLKILSFSPQILRTLQPRELFLVRNKTVVLALEDPEGNPGDHLCVVPEGGSELAPTMLNNPGERLRALGPLKDGRLCVERSKIGVDRPESTLEAFDGARFETLAEQPPDTIGTNWHTLFVAQNGDWWLSNENGTACYSDEKWRTFPATSDKSTPENARWFAESAEGRIWCADAGQIWEFDGRSWSIIRRGFDRINAMLRTRDGGIWVASNSGLFRNIKGSWIENGTEEGLPSAGVLNIYEDSRGRLWTATNRGLSLFHPEADPDPPETFVQSFPGTESGLPEGSTLSLTFSGQDKWKYTPRERLLYSSRLDERDWSAFQEVSRVSFSDLSAGRHYFQVRAMDRNGNVDPQHAKLEFVVMPPWYKEARLVLISSAAGIVALFFAAVAFNRHRRLLRSYAEIEGKVAERTHQLEVANRELLHSQKMTALGTLAAGIAHDFNNILSIIKGSTQIIEEHLDNPEKVRLRTDRIKLVVEQGTGIVKAMLGFSRDSGQEPALCDLNEVVQDTLKLVGDRFLREVQVSFQPAPDLPGVLASKDFLQQILLNFIFNAAESMEKAKQIVLSTGLIADLPADLVLLPIPADRYLTVSVQDSGSGITPENLPRIFEPFFTTKAMSTRRGTGLGLSMVYELAKKLGAGLSVKSVVGLGSRFTVILPVRDLGTK